MGVIVTGSRQVARMESRQDYFLRHLLYAETYYTAVNVLCHIEMAI